MKDNKTAHNADEYDRKITLTIPNYTLFHAQTIELVRTVRKNPRIWLDTGCGTGNLIEKALPEFPTTDFILADPSPEMLAQVRRKASSRTDRVLLLDPCETQDIELGDRGRPDVLTAIQSHHYYRESGRETATRHCYDLLEAGGLFVTFENIRSLTEEGVEIGKSRWRDYQVGSGKTGDEAEAQLKRFDTEFFPITVEEHLALYRKTGFRVVELLWFSYMQAGFYCIK
jgi:tRNA (cmo5U34)-methyltransferase